MPIAGGRSWMTCCGGTAKSCATTTIASPTITTRFRARDLERSSTLGEKCMNRTASQWLAMAALAAAGGMHNSAVVGQTPEEQKAWEAQRVQIQAQEKARAELLARQRQARRADPMAWVRTL